MTNDSDALFMQTLNSKLIQGDVPGALRMMREHPEHTHRTNDAVTSWLHAAATYGRVPVVEHLLNTGADINYASGVEKWTPLDSAVTADDSPNRTEVVRTLLDRGADPNLSRVLLGAINSRRGDEPTSLELVRLLVEVGGADVNREYDWFGDPNNTFTALEFAEQYGRAEIAAYLRSKGAVNRPPRPAPAPPAKKKKKR